MSIVVLRSWKDDPKNAPKIRGIAKDTDDKDDAEIVPDFKGRFVTAEPYICRPMNRKIYSEDRNKLGKNKTYWPDYSTLPSRPNKKIQVPIETQRKLSDSTENNASPSPTQKQNELRPNLVRSRECLTSSPDSDNISSPPHSPLASRGDYSRYKKLSSDLAQTIPRRMLRANWMQNDDENDGRADLSWRRSDSSPSLNDHYDNNSNFNSLSSDDIRSQQSFSPTKSPSPSYFPYLNSPHTIQRHLPYGQKHLPPPSPDTDLDKVVLVEVIKKKTHSPTPFKPSHKLEELQKRSENNNSLLSNKSNVQGSRPVESVCGSNLAKSDIQLSIEEVRRAACNSSGRVSPKRLVIENNWSDTAKITTASGIIGNKANGFAFQEEEEAEDEEKDINISKGKSESGAKNSNSKVNAHSINSGWEKPSSNSSTSNNNAFSSKKYSPVVSPTSILPKKSFPFSEIEVNRSQSKASEGNSVVSAPIISNLDFIVPTLVVKDVKVAEIKIDVNPEEKEKGKKSEEKSKNKNKSQIEIDSRKSFFRAVNGDRDREIEDATQYNSYSYTTTVKKAVDDKKFRPIIEIDNLNLKSLREESRSNKHNTIEIEDTSNSNNNKNEPINKLLHSNWSSSSLKDNNNLKREKEDEEEEEFNTKTSTINSILKKEGSNISRPESFRLLKPISDSQKDSNLYYTSVNNPKNEHEFHSYILNESSPTITTSPPSNQANANSNQLPWTSNFSEQEPTQYKLNPEVKLRAVEVLQRANNEEDPNKIIISTSSSSTSKSTPPQIKDEYKKHTIIIKSKEMETAVPLTNGNLPNGIGGASPLSIATARVPVQCVNKYVYSEDLPTADWNSSPVRDSLRGFCRELLNNKEGSKGGGKPLGESKKLRKEDFCDDDEGVINFEDDECSELSSNLEMDNSIDYISIGSVQVGSNMSNNAKNSLFLNNFGSSTSSRRSKSSGETNNNKIVISLDFGSRKLAFACHFNEKTFVSERYESIFLVDKSNPLGNFQVGRKALKSFLQQQSKLINPNQNLKLLSKWRELVQINSGAAYPYSLDSQEFDPKILLKSIFYYFGREALKYLKGHFEEIHLGNSSGNEITWIVSIPCNWTTTERKLLREAAWESGLLKPSRDTLCLILDPLASFHLLDSKINDGLGMPCLLLDLGSSFLHYTVLQYDNEIPEKWQILSSGSELYKNSSNSNFEKLLGELFTREFILNYKTKWGPGWIELTRNWEEAKCNFNEEENFPNIVYLPANFAREFFKYTSMEIEDCMVNGISYNENGCLIISKDKMVNDFLNPSIDFIISKIEKLRKDFNVEKIYITGGFCKCKYLRKKLGATINFQLLSQEPELSVLHGSLLSKISSKKSHKIAIKCPFSLGVGVMTPFDSNAHPDEKRLNRNGKDWCRDVWDSLIKVGQDIELNKVLIKRSYVGAQPNQNCLVLPIFKCYDLPKFTTEKSVQKCCELRFETSDMNYKQVELSLESLNCEIMIRANDVCVLVDL